MVFNKSFTLFLSKIRLSAHSLAIETGRCNKPFTPAEERYCKYCLNQVENEKHFLLYCPLYNCIRESFQSILKNSQYFTDDDLLLQIIQTLLILKIPKIPVYLSKNHSPKEKHLKVTVCLLPNIAFII